MSPRQTSIKGRRREDAYAWLDLVVTDGPFLARPALKAQFADGLPRPDATVDGVARSFAEGFRLWEKAWTGWVTSPKDDAANGRYLAERDAWVRTVTRDVLEWDGYVIDGPAGLSASSLDGEHRVAPTAVLRTGEQIEAVLLVVDPTEDLAALGSDGWSASALDRAAALLRAARSTGEHAVALVSDGRWWSLVWLSDQGSVGSGTFDGALFREEPGLRDAFWALARLTSLVGGAPERRLPALLAASVASTEEITDQLGRQVRAAVELLVQSFSESHLNAVAAGEPSPLPEDGHEVYDAAVTTMMRAVFLLFAEANQLLPDSVLYREGYGISDVAERLDARRRATASVDGEELLEGTYDTWHRLLATSRALFDGATFEDLRMPAYGGSLFDPDRFPWLLATEPTTGRLRVVVDDRVMLHVLRAVQHVRIKNEDRTVSFRELDVEQIGYVYEGLLGYSARFIDRDETIVGLDGPEDGAQPEVPVEVLHDLVEESDEDPPVFTEKLLAWLKQDQPGAKPRTARQIATAFAASGTTSAQDEARRLLRPVVRDETLVEELVGYIHLIRRDLRGLPYVVLGGGLVVVETRSRANSGTHYTPRSLAEEVVQHALEPLVYRPGPLQTAETSEWRLISSSEILELKVVDIAVGSGAFLVAAARYLGGKLLEAWDAEGITSGDASADRRRRREIEARREVLAHCLYGADINAMAVEMCKLSLWLVSLDRDKPFSFVDDKIFCGNSLLGLTELRQLRGLHIDPSPARLRDPGFTVDVELAIQRATEVREQLSTTVSDGDAMRTTRAKRQLIRQLDEHLRDLRTVADSVVAAGLALGGKPGKGLDASYENLSLALMNAQFGDTAMLDKIVEAGLTPMAETDYERWQPLHWILAAPDVMTRGGFDAVVGNPPFLGGKKISGTHGSNLREYLVNAVAGGRKGEADLVVYFIIRALDVVRPNGKVALIASESVAEGEGRRVGLEPLLRGGARVYRAEKRRKWPTEASVHFSTLWLETSSTGDEAVVHLDGRRVRAIDASLEANEGREGSPVRLAENAGISFMGAILSGQGFVVKPEERDALLKSDPATIEVLRPYVNGSDVNQSSHPGPSSEVIDFAERCLEEAASYPAALDRIRTLVKPARDRTKKKQYRERWWRFAERGVGLNAALQEVDAVMAIVLTSDTMLPVRLGSNSVFSNSIGVIALSSYSDFAVLSSSVHQVWAIRWGSSLDAACRYTPSDVFETFPRPGRGGDLEWLGRQLDEERRKIMMVRDLGLTKLYKRVNDPAVTAVHDPDVGRLRALHAEVDKAVMIAYGWKDVPLEHGFHTYRQVERWTVSPVARAEILDRLLEENHRRAATQGDVGALLKDADETVEGEGL